METPAADAMNNSSTPSHPQSEEEAMASAYRRAMGDAPEAGGRNEAEGGSEASGNERPVLRDEKGRFVSKQENQGNADQPSQDVAGEGGNGGEVAEVAEAADDPWQTLPEPVKEKVSQLEDFVRPWTETLQPHFDYLSRLQKETGMTPHDVVGRLMQAEQMLRYGTYEQKQSLLQQMAQDYGVVLSAQDQADNIDDADLLGPQVPITDPKHPDYAQYHDLTQQNAALQARLEALEAQQRAALEQQQAAQVESQIEAFRSATDEHGQPKYPHFEIVAERMGALLDAGQAASMEEAYALSVKPVEERLAALAQDQAARAARAKSASGVNVETQAGGNEQDYQSIDEAMSAAYRSVMKH